MWNESTNNAYSSADSSELRTVGVVLDSFRLQRSSARSCVLTPHHHHSVRHFLLLTTNPSALVVRREEQDAPALLTMRLLKIRDASTFDLVEFTARDTPPYAILSHTWGPDHEEVNFRDITSKKKTTKTGFRKLEFCAQQTLQHGLDYFWIDTCCIDKSSSAELTEAINSMFQWYRKANRCYVYLTDVALIGNTIDERLIQSSRWFTRGWTLQELLAPARVQFYDVAGHFMGSRASLLGMLKQATGISQRALEGEDLSYFSIETRFSWAAYRETSREEDAAYSLLGIFGVHMPLIYGEGRRSAFLRLRKAIDECVAYQDLDLDFSGTSSTATSDNFSRPGGSDQSLAKERRTRAIAQTTPYASPASLGNLRYPRMEERRLQIQTAQFGTYRWILDSNSYLSAGSDSFLKWLSSPSELRHVYWIFGKPGSGKSTVMRYLDQNIATTQHMQPWAEARSVLKLHHYFWNLGSEKQMSIVGSLRALLYQLLTSNPRSATQIEIDGERVIASDNDAYLSEVVQQELQDNIRFLIESKQNESAIFILLDGLDELSGSDDKREQIIDFVKLLSNMEHVKICVSSRPWNTFTDAFEDYPKLKLESLTYDDIANYVETTLSNNKRFNHLAGRRPAEAHSLIRDVCERASGVFLWIRLVVKELLAGLRDGDGLNELQVKLQSIPRELDGYFKRLVHSIPIHQRYEASVILQISLYKERDFTTLHPVRLFDLFFTAQEDQNFSLSCATNLVADFLDAEALAYLLDSTLRRVNSRCMGLLEWNSSGARTHLDCIDPLSALSTALGETTDRSQSAESQNLRLHQGQSMHVQFIHLSCRDFLSTPEIQDLLLEQSKGRFNVERYLVNARICQFLALTAVGKRTTQAVSLASNIISSLARPSFRDTSESSQLAALVRPGLEKLIRDYDTSRSNMYINASITSWEEERSSFFTLAIDFELTEYVRRHMTAGYVSLKRGRPVIDYILRPRFSGMESDMKIGNQKPNADHLMSALRLGANPNGLYGS